ncbi:hypothetical protein L0244_03405 [bacterium]|nr:hypothetical protein [bacterium]
MIENNISVFNTPWVSMLVGALLSAIIGFVGSLILYVKAGKQLESEAVRLRKFSNIILAILEGMIQPQQQPGQLRSFKLIRDENGEVTSIHWFLEIKETISVTDNVNVKEL